MARIRKDPAHAGFLPPSAHPVDREPAVDIHAIRIPILGASACNCRCEPIGWTTTSPGETW